MSTGDFGALALQTRERLNSLWSEVGLTDEERQTELEIIVNSVRAVYNDRLNREEAHVAELRDAISTITAEIKAVLASIEATSSEVAAVDTKPRGVSLRDKVSSLKADLAAVTARRDERAAVVSDKFNELVALWEEMGVPRKPGFEELGSDISASRLAALSSEVLVAAEEREKLGAAVRDLSQEISDQFTELAIETEATLSPSDEVGSVISAHPRVGGDVAATLVRLELNELDKKIVSGDFASVGVHASTIKALQDRTVLLSDMRSQRTAKLHEFAQSIMPLWRRLSVPIDEQQQWVKTNGGLSIQALRSCQLEIIRLLELQQEALGPMIEAARAKVVELWDHLMISHEERAQFVDFHSTELSDEVLQAHEQHIALLTARANAMRPVLELIARRDELKRTALVLAEMEQDPDRYKKPRHLIEEERLRKALRAVPRIEADIRAQVPAWEAQYGEFRLDGVRYLDLLEDEIEAEAVRKEEDRITKERERDAKRAAKSGGRSSDGPLGRAAAGATTRAAGGSWGGAGSKKGTGKGRVGVAKENVY